ncbi:hypothetical protein BB559_002498 [Furculomyces boomerangus]|uniref:UDP-N-acetylglucosamine diphosphorylase n=2 Tax=Harpellales TaxID=61421 RepID=A0A2T9YUY7_9FUNG|nr:hypothetical protein BB559_002498 [Furculomyces boomerangus]PWA02371.1 hypothetical protein BB558_001478 [Smittium angustum]
MVPDNPFLLLKARYHAAGQDHIFRDIEKLPQDQLDAFLAELQELKIEDILANFHKAVIAEESPCTDHTTIQPLDESEVDSLITSPPETVRKWYEEGLSCIAKNQVAAIVMAGGQGTRLGSSSPKGCYKVGIPSDKSLFQIQAERIIRLEQIAAESAKIDPSTVVINWLVMTSLATRYDTEKFFEENNYFGLRKSQVKIFDQGSVPCFTMDGKLILEGVGKISKSPDGNGGLYYGLRSSNILQELKQAGVKYFHACGIDNILVRVADPWFIGYSVLKKAETGALGLPKQSWDEKVGVICKKNGKYNVLEYSEIPEELAKMTRPSGSLYYNEGNICNHFFSTEFLERVEDFESELQYHIAKKKINYFDFETGKLVIPAKPNGIKLERFVFDVFLFAKRLSVLNVKREELFSPLKNPPGSSSDCPETSRADLIRLHVKFAEDAGAIVQGKARTSFEISPLVSYFGEGLEHLAGKTFVEETIIEK